MAWLDAELLRLRALCAAHGIDASPGAPPPGPPRAASAAAAAAAAAAPGAAAPGALPAAAAVPTTEQMYEDLEAILERCHPLIPSNTAIAYLTARSAAAWPSTLSGNSMHTLCDVPWNHTPCLLRKPHTYPLTHPPLNTPLAGLPKDRPRDAVHAVQLAPQALLFRAAG